MRLTLSLAVLLLLVGAGCATTRDADDTGRASDDTPVITADVATNTGMVSGDAVTVSSTVAKSDDKIVERDDKRDNERDDESDDEGGDEDDRDDDKTTVTKPVVTPVVKPATTTPVVTQPVTAGPKTYTMADVKAQTAAGNCWSAIGGQVYDLGAWINKHPGGAASIRSLCGIDGTAKFNAVHGGQAKPERVLAGFSLGALK